MEVVRDGQAEEVATNGRQRWPLSPSTTLRLTMSQASPEASSDKVPWAGRCSCAGLGAGGPGRYLDGPDPRGQEKPSMGHTCRFQFSHNHIKRAKRETSPVVRWLGLHTVSAGLMGAIPGQGTVNKVPLYWAGWLISK